MKKCANCTHHVVKMLSPEQVLAGCVYWARDLLTEEVRHQHLTLLFEEEERDVFVQGDWQIKLHLTDGWGK